MGLSKTLRKVFKIRKKKDDRDDDDDRGHDRGRPGGQNYNQNQQNLNRGRSIRGGIYEPYRQHFPLKSQMPDYGSQMGHYASNYPQVQGFQQDTQQQQPGFGPKLVTSNEGGQTNYPYVRPLQAQNGNQRPINGRLNRASSDASVCSYRPVNYQHHNPMINPRYGSNLSINQAGLANAAEAYENHAPNGRRPARSNSINFSSTYEHLQPGRQGLTRQGSVSSIQQVQSNYPNYNLTGRPRRPSSAVIPSRSMSDAGAFVGLVRPGRPSSAQGSCLQLDQCQNFDGSAVMSPMSEYSSSLNSSFVNSSSVNRVMSPIGSTYGMSPGLSSASSFDVQQQSTFALHQLRSSQANLQQALRVQEDLSRQGGNAKPAELDATMKIMQTCLDMLDSISGLVERSTTPVPQSITGFNPVQQQLPHRMFDHQLNDAPIKKNFINHQTGMKPIKSALKQRIPTTTSAFETIQKNNEEIKEASPGLSDSSEGFYGSGSQDESNSGLESPALSQTSPGPSVLSEDSGYGLQMGGPIKMDQSKWTNQNEPIKMGGPINSDLSQSDPQLNTGPPMLSSLTQLKIGSN
jgi:hypothetical protein